MNNRVIAAVDGRVAELRADDLGKTLTPQAFKKISAGAGAGAKGPACTTGPAVGPPPPRTQPKSWRRPCLASPERPSGRGDSEWGFPSPQSGDSSSPIRLESHRVRLVRSRADGSGQRGYRQRLKVQVGVHGPDLALDDQ